MLGKVSPARGSETPPNLSARFLPSLADFSVASFHSRIVRFGFACRLGVNRCATPENTTKSQPPTIARRYLIDARKPGQPYRMLVAHSSGSEKAQTLGNAAVRPRRRSLFLFEKSFRSVFSPLVIRKRRKTLRRINERVRAHFLGVQ